MKLDNTLDRIKCDGYALVPKVFSSEYCDSVKESARKYINELSIDYGKYDNSKSVLADKSQEMVLNNIQNKDYMFMDLISASRTTSVIAKLLQEGSYGDSEPFHLINSQIRALKPFATAQQLHIDSNLPGLGGFCLVAVVIVMLDDFTEENGATRVVPGSHTIGCYADNGVAYPEEILITGSKGDVIIFDGALWHGSSPNLSSMERWSVNIGYGRWFLKPSFDIARSLVPSIYQQMSEFEKDLLGLKTVPPLDEFQRITRKSQSDFLHWDVD